jgi:hypothetical protein
MNEYGDALREIRTAIQRGEKVLCVHYACENFFEVTDRPAAVTCIAVAQVGGPALETAFSISNSLPNEEVVEREKDLLRRFFDEVRVNPDARIVHWNMNSAHYGFTAIASRYSYLFGSSPGVVPSPDRLYDLDAMIADRFGEVYAKHPKFRTVAMLNGFWMPFFKSGKDEAAAAKSADYGTIERSTTEKAHLISEMLTRLCDGTLKTLNSVGAVKFASEHLDAVKVILRLGEKFREVERALLRRHAKRETLRITDEYDAQDLLRALLVQFFDDVRDEDWAPTYAGAASRIDFVMPAFELAVELKYARESMSARTLGEQLIVDREKYAQHGSVRHLVCLVFDHDGFIPNPRGIEADLTREHSLEGLAVTVRIFDR